jgi:hypothetical protein
MCSELALDLDRRGLRKNIPQISARWGHRTLARPEISVRTAHIFYRSDIVIHPKYSPGVYMSMDILIQLHYIPVCTTHTSMDVAISLTSLVLMNCKNVLHK